MSEPTSKLIFSQNFENQLSSASVSSISSFEHHLSAKGSCFVFSHFVFFFFSFALMDRSFDLLFFRSFQSALLQEIQNQSTVRFFLSKKVGESSFLCAFRLPISGGLANAVEASRRPNGGNKHDSTGSFLDFASVSFTLSSLLYFLSLFAHFNGSHLTSG